MFQSKHIEYSWMGKKVWSALCCQQETHLRQKTHTDWKWRVGNKFSKQTSREKCRCSNTHVRKNRVPKKGHKERPRRSLHNTQRENPRGRHKHCKYICTQHRSTQIHKENLRGVQKDIDSNTIRVGDFNTLWSKMDISSKQNINKDIVTLNNVLDQIHFTVI